MVRSNNYIGPARHGGIPVFTFSRASLIPCIVEEVATSTEYRLYLPFYYSGCGSFPGNNRACNRPRGCTQLRDIPEGKKGGIIQIQRKASGKGANEPGITHAMRWPLNGRLPLIE